MTDQSELLWHIDGAAGIIVLNRPAALNALTLGMVREMNVALDAFERDANVRCVIVRGAGEKAFCAGGDIRLLYDQGRAGEHAAQLTFWREEYLLNIRIKHFPKPYLSLINGIVMGGGVGVSQHGTYRVASESYMFAMPEVGIGFFPDVGATYFLPRLPDRFGIMLALTGARAHVGDAVAFGLVDFHVPLAQFEALQAALCAGGEVTDTLKTFAMPVTPGPHFETRLRLAGLFEGTNAEVIFGRLQAAPEAFAQKFAADMAKKSAFSIAIAAEQMRRGREATIEDAMSIEYRVVSRICRGNDFYEGVRATLIDKSTPPRWEFAQLSDVPRARVDAMFAPLSDGELIRR